MGESAQDQLSRRERQIMQAIYSMGKASVGEVQKALPDAPSYSAVRALMRILEEKGLLKHESQGNKYIYMPRRPRHVAGKSAIRRLLHTFFDGSVERAVAALLSTADTKLSPSELDRLAELIKEHKKKEQRR
jgi:predicted transcriptional regulator